MVEYYRKEQNKLEQAQPNEKTSMLKSKNYFNTLQRNARKLRGKKPNAKKPK